GLAQDPGDGGGGGHAGRDAARRVPDPRDLCGGGEDGGGGACAAAAAPGGACGDGSARGAAVKRFAAATALAALSAGCVGGPDYKRPPVTVPERVYGQLPADAELPADLPSWGLFQDPVLRG